METGSHRATRDLSITLVGWSDVSKESDSYRLNPLRVSATSFVASSNPEACPVVDDWHALMGLAFTSLSSARCRARIIPRNLVDQSVCVECPVCAESGNPDPTDGGI